MTSVDLLSNCSLVLLCVLLNKAKSYSSIWQRDKTDLFQGKFACFGEEKKALQEFDEFEFRRIRILNMPKN